MRQYRVRVVLVGGVEWNFSGSKISEMLVEIERTLEGEISTIQIQAFERDDKNVLTEQDLSEVA